MIIVTTSHKPEDGEDQIAEEEPIRPIRVVPISTVIPITMPNPEFEMIGSDKGKRESTDETEEPTKKLVPASREAHHDSDEPAKEDKLLEMTKSELIKVVHKEVEKAEIDPKILESAKGGQEFKKIHDANRLKPKPITDVKIHPNSKPAILIVIEEMIEGTLRFITSSGLEAFRLNNIREELKIQYALLAPAPEQGSSQLTGRKRKKMELESEIRIPILECNISLPEGFSYVNNIVFEESEYWMFFIDVFGDEAVQRKSDIKKVRVDTLITYLVMASNITIPENTRFRLKLKRLIANHPDREKLKSKKVKLEFVGYKLDLLLYVILYCLL
ncbi:hypothetical protein Tco_0150788 [Tanacetum coccineum]